jgi:hypothetical protein
VLVLSAVFADCVADLKKGDINFEACEFRLNRRGVQCGSGRNYVRQGRSGKAVLQIGVPRCTAVDF